MRRRRRRNPKTSTLLLIGAAGWALYRKSKGLPILPSGL